jgi:hypothetical protein
VYCVDDSVFVSGETEPLFGLLVQLVVSSSFRIHTRARNLESANGWLPGFSLGEPLILPERDGENHARGMSRRQNRRPMGVMEIPRPGFLFHQSR